MCTSACGDDSGGDDHDDSHHDEDDDDDSDDDSEDDDIVDSNIVDVLNCRPSAKSRRLLEAVAANTCGPQLLFYLSWICLIFAHFCWNVFRCCRICAFVWLYVSVCVYVTRSVCEYGRDNCSLPPGEPPSHPPLPWQLVATTMMMSLLLLLVMRTRMRKQLYGCIDESQRIPNAQSVQKHFCILSLSLPHIAQIDSVHILRPLVALKGKGGEEYGLSQHLYIHTCIVEANIGQVGCGLSQHYMTPPFTTYCGQYWTGWAGCWWWCGLSHFVAEAICANTTSTRGNCSAIYSWVWKWSFSKLMSFFSSATVMQKLLVAVHIACTLSSKWEMAFEHVASA